MKTVLLPAHAVGRKTGKSALAHAMLKEIPYSVWFDNVIYPLAVGDASRILSRLRKEIRRTGGERQRGEGLPLITRIQLRLDGIKFPKKENA